MNSEIRTQPWSLVEFVDSKEGSLHSTAEGSIDFASLYLVFRKYDLESEATIRSSREIMWSTLGQEVVLRDGKNELAELLACSFDESPSVDIYLRIDYEQERLSLDIGSTLSLLRFIRRADVLEKLAWEPRVEAIELEERLDASIEAISKHLDDMLGQLLLPSSHTSWSVGPT